MTIWCVSVADTDRNYRRKRDAIVALRAQCQDVRIRPTIVRHCRGCYTFYGPGRDEIVLRARINKLQFPSFRGQVRG